MKMEFNKAAKWVLIGALIPLLIDMLFVFPISHNSIIGNKITSFMSDIIVPWADKLAVAIGVADPAGVLSTSSTGGGMLNNMALNDIPAEISPN